MIKMSDRLFFIYERMEPLRYPEPRDIRSILQRKYCGIHKGVDISDLPYSTEIIVKSIKAKDPSKADHILLKYKVINVDWEELRHEKNIKFDSSDFRWLNITEQNYDE